MRKEQSARAKGCYHNDYSPRYQEPFDIYEKARAHVRAQKKREREKREDHARE